MPDSSTPRTDHLNVWRNAVVHQSFVLKPHHQALVQGTNPDHLVHVRAWRRSCDALAVEFDRVVRSYVSRVVGGPPWE